MGLIGGEQRTSGGTIQRALTRFYGRHGVAGLLVLSVVSSYLIAMIFLGFILAASASYVGASLQQVAPYFLMAGAGLLVAGAVGLYASRDDLRVVLSWAGVGRSRDNAVAVWRAAVAMPRLVLTRVGITTYLMVLAALPVWLADFDQPVWSYAPNVVIWALFIPAIAVFVLLGVEFLHRPAVQDIAAHLPSDFEPLTSTLSLRTKAILPIPGATYLAVGLGGAFVDSTADYTTRITIGLGLGLASAAIAMVLFLLLTHAALDPIDALTDATERVRGGDLATPVPVLSADELGILAKSFNHMLDGLRERESLREHNVALLEDVRASRARIVATADAERRRMERDLHDGAQQRLVLINLKLEMLTREVSDNARAGEFLEELRADAKRAVDELRDLAHGIYPPLLESDGLAGALEDVADHSPIPATIDRNGIGRYPSPVEAAVYFCCLEALQNAAKHAGDGSHVRIHLSDDEGELHFKVADDGHGFDPTRTNGSAGLQNMTDRIGSLGGTVRIDSEPGRGTTVSGTVPLGT